MGDSKRNTSKFRTFFFIALSVIAVGISIFFHEQYHVVLLKSGESFVERDKDTGVEFKFDVKPLETVESPFQKISMMESRFFGKMLTIDGALMVTEKDEANYHEMISHVPLNYMPRAKRVLIIGGGDGGTLREVLRHPNIEEVLMVDIDRMVIDMSKHYFLNNRAAFEDPRAMFYYEDGAAFVKRKLATEAGSFDLVIVDSTDYDWAASLMTDEFYENCKSLLKPAPKPGFLPEDGYEGSALVFNVNSPSWALPTVLKATQQLPEIFRHAYLYHTVQPTYLSGHYSFMICSDYIHPYRTRIPWGDYLAKHLTMQYYSPDIHISSFALPTFMTRAMKQRLSLADAAHNILSA